MLKKIKRHHYFLVVIFLFIIIALGHVLTIPAFEGPDESGHFLYSFYISKYNRIPQVYSESISPSKYIIEKTGNGLNDVFYMDEKYMFYRAFH